MNAFHSTIRWLEPGSVEVADIGDISSGPRMIVSHEALEKVVFLYMLEGEMRVTLSDAGRTTLRANDVMVIFPGRILTVEMTARANRLMAVTLFGRNAVRATLGLGYWDLMRTSEPYVENYMSEIIDRFHAAPEHGRDAAILSQVEHLLSSIWLRMRLTSGNGDFFDAVRSLNRQICTMACPTTETAADALGISRSKLNSLFMDGLHVRPGEYIARATCSLAQAALFFTKDSVSSIARGLGFSSASAFATFMKRRIGQTPAEFRHRPIFDA